MTAPVVPSWYRTLVVIGSSLASVMLSAFISIYSVNHALDVERRADAKAEQEAQRAREESRRITCVTIIAQDEVYQEEPARTPAGKKAAQAWHDLRSQLCS